MEPESRHDLPADVQAAEAGPAAPFVALRHRDFRVIWAGTFVSNVGSWAQKVATSWLIYDLTGSEAWLGLDAFASGFLMVLLLPWGGVVSDRVDRRKLLIATNITSAGLAFVLAACVVSGTLQVWQIVLVSALAGVIQAFMVPASASMLPRLVGEQDTANAIALNSLQFNVSRIVGPAIAGVTLIHLGAMGSFVLNGLSFLVMAIVLSVISPIPAAHLSAESALYNLRSGLRLVKEAGNIQTLLALIILTAFFGAPMISMLPALTTSVLHRDAATYSLLLSSFGTGAVLAAARSAFQSRRGVRPCRAVPYLIVFGVCLFSVSFAVPIYVAVTLTALSGFSFISTMIRLGTALVQASPDEYRGRITSLQSLGFRLGQPLGALVAGILAYRFGVSMTFCIFGVLLLITVLGVRQLSTSLRAHKLISRTHLHGH